MPPEKYLSSLLGLSLTSMGDELDWIENIDTLDKRHFGSVVKQFWGVGRINSVLATLTYIKA